MIKILLFDIDGTLLMTGGAGRIAFDNVFRELFGIPRVWQDMMPDGKTDPMIMEELSQKALGRSLSPDEYAQVCDRYQVHFENEIENSSGFHVLPGIRKLLDRLSNDRERLLGIATGNFESTAYLKLKRGGLDGYFRFGGFGSDSLDRTLLTLKAFERSRQIAGEPLSMRNVMVIGDSIHDIRAGKNLGAATVAVATGKTTFPDLKDEMPDYLFQDLSDTEAFLNLLRSAFP